MFKRNTIEEESIYYCKECNKLYKKCYDLDNICMCISCFSEEIKVLPEDKIRQFIRNKRLKKLNEISK